MDPLFFSNDTPIESSIKYFNKDLNKVTKILTLDVAPIFPINQMLLEGMNNDLFLLASRIAQFSDEYMESNLTDLSIIDESYRSMRTLSFAVKSSIQKLENDPATQFSTVTKVVTLMDLLNDKSWVLSDLSKILTTNLEKMVSKKPNQNLKIVENLKNQNLEIVIDLCSSYRNKSLTGNYGMNVLVSLIEEKSFDNALLTAKNLIGSTYKITHLMINQLLSKKTILEKDWVCKAYLFADARSRGIADSHTYTIYMKTSADHGRYDVAKEIFKEANQLGSKFINPLTHCFFIMAAVDHNYDDAEAAFEDAKDKNMLNPATAKLWHSCWSSKT